MKFKFFLLMIRIEGLKGIEGDWRGIEGDWKGLMGID